MLKKIIKNKKVIFSLILLIGVFFIISDNKIGILNNKNNYTKIKKLASAPGEILTDCTYCKVNKNETIDLNPRMSDEYLGDDKTTGFTYEILSDESNIDFITIDENGKVYATNIVGLSQNFVIRIKKGEYSKEVYVYVVTGGSVQNTILKTNNSLIVPLTELLNNTVNDSNADYYNVTYYEGDECNDYHSPSDLNDYKFKNIPLNQLSFKISNLAENKRYCIDVAYVKNNEKYRQVDFGFGLGMDAIYTRYNTPSKPKFADVGDTENKWYNAESRNGNICFSITNEDLDNEEYQYIYWLDTKDSVINTEYLNNQSLWTKLTGTYNECSNHKGWMPIDNETLKPGPNYLYTRKIPKDGKSNGSEPSKPLLILYDNEKPSIVDINEEIGDETTKVIIKAQDQSNLSGVNKFQYKLADADSNDEWKDFENNNNFKTFSTDEVNKEYQFRVIDKAGNISDTVTKKIVTNPIKLDDESNYKIEKSTTENISYISNITTNTDLSTFKENFSTLNAKIYSKDAKLDESGENVTGGEEVTIGKVTTGMLVYSSELKLSYRIVVKGDLHGTGGTYISDATQALGNLSFMGNHMSELLTKAADMNNDGNIAINDVSSMLGIIVSLDS